MKLNDFLRSKALILCFLVAAAIIWGVFAYFSGVGTAFLWCSEAIFLIGVSAWIVVSFFLERNRLKKLEDTISGLTEKYLLGELLPTPLNIAELQYFKVMKEVSRSAIGAVQQANREKAEYGEYVERWIHEIKTPLTACSLILLNGGDSSKLKRELKRADNLTESILYYARMGSIEKDTAITEIHVSEIIHEAVRSQLDIFIAAKIAVETTGDFTVYTDGKTLCFILKQLLINCVKYCPGCKIKINAQNGVITVEDNGIGIMDYELSRVTERGFTGTNGRRLGGSTGMGLYIVSGLCRKMDMDFKLYSQTGLFTRAELSFESLQKCKII